MFPRMIKLHLYTVTCQRSPTAGLTERRGRDQKLTVRARLLHWLLGSWAGLAGTFPPPSSGTSLSPRLAVQILPARTALMH